jgi:hypothetical protein
MMNDAKIIALRKELDSIHFANVLYWREGTEHSLEANTEYLRRHDRLPEIQLELTDLGFPR